MFMAVLCMVSPAQASALDDHAFFVRAYMTNGAGTEARNVSLGFGAALAAGIGGIETTTRWKIAQVFSGEVFCPVIVPTLLGLLFQQPLTVHTGDRVEHFRTVQGCEGNPVSYSA